MYNNDLKEHSSWLSFIDMFSFDFSDSHTQTKGARSARLHTEVIQGRHINFFLHFGAFSQICCASDIYSKNTKYR